MATLTLNHFDVTRTFQNIVATIAGAGSVNVEVQNVGDVDIEVVSKAAGGAPDSSATTGIILGPRQRFTFNNAQLWVKTLNGKSSRVSLTTL